MILALADIRIHSGQNAVGEAAIGHLSAAWELRPGDLIVTGTPEGVAADLPGDTLEGSVEGLHGIRVALV